jgi:hypothetical protein
MGAPLARAMSSMVAAPAESSASARAASRMVF